MPWAADGRDGNRLHLVKKRLIFFRFIASVSLKVRLWYIFSWKIQLISISISYAKYGSNFSQF